MQQVVNEFIPIRSVSREIAYTPRDEQARDNPQARPSVPGGASRHRRLGARWGWRALRDGRPNLHESIEAADTWESYTMSLPCG